MILQLNRSAGLDENSLHRVVVGYRSRRRGGRSSRSDGGGRLGGIIHCPGVHVCASPLALLLLVLHCDSLRGTRGGGRGVNVLLRCGAPKTAQTLGARTELRSCHGGVIRNADWSWTRYSNRKINNMQHQYMSTRLQFGCLCKME